MIGTGLTRIDVSTNPLVRLASLLAAMIMLVTSSSGCAAYDVWGNAKHALPENGDVWSLFYGSARYIIDGVLSGEPFSQAFISKDGKMVIFARTIADGWGWIITDRSIPLEKLNYANGNLTNASTFGDFSKWLTDNGWTIVKAGAGAVMAETWAQIQALGASLSNIELVPIFMILPPGYDPADVISTGGDT